MKRLQAWCSNLTYGRYTIEVDRFQDVVPSEGRQSPKIERPKTADFSTGNPITDFIAKIAPPTEPVAALNYWGSIGSIIGGLLAIFQIYEMASGRKVKNAIDDMQRDIDGLVGNSLPSTNKKRRKSKPSIEDVFGV